MNKNISGNCPGEGELISRCKKKKKKKKWDKQ